MDSMLTIRALAEVFLLGGIGALARFAVLVFAAQRFGAFPVGILAVNTLAALIGSFLVAAAIPAEPLLAVGGGFVGSLGTLSSLCSEIIAMHKLGKHEEIVLFVVLSLATGIAATLIGLEAGEAYHA